MSRLDFVIFSRLLTAPAALVLILPWAISYARNSYVQLEEDARKPAPHRSPREV